MKTQIVLVIALTCIFVGIGPSARGQDRASTEVPEGVKTEKARLHEFAARHGAVDSWTDSLPDRGMGKVFSIDLTRVLVRTNTEPVAMVAFLDDVSEENGVFTVHFSTFDLSGRVHFPDLRLNLRCSAQQVEEILNVHPHVGEKGFAIAVRVEAVSRAAFAVEKPEGGDAYHIDFSDCPDVFFVKGALVAFEPRRPKPETEK